MTRAMMLEVLRQDFIRTAWSKGLQERWVIYRHALKNAVIPVVTVVGIQIHFLIGGTIVMENIFGLPGMGNFIITSVSSRDYPMLQAGVLFFSSLVILTNLAVDLSYAFLDPRVRYQ